MRGLLLLLLACPLVAQEGPATGILRGELLKWNADAGEFNVRSRDLRVHRCSFDENTYLTKEGVRIVSSDVKAGSVVELVVDTARRLEGCHAVTLYVLKAVPSSLSAEYLRLLERQRHLLDHIVPRGNLTLAGVVVRFDPEHLILKTRSEGRKTIRLRDDTRYTYEGRPVDASMLEVNARVFVRAGKTYDGEIEAYQIVRGHILTPSQPRFRD